ncbi:MAG TPA: hypothetical protein VH817_08250 [Thermoleophilaceae bacterium]
MKARLWLCALLFGSLLAAAAPAQAANTESLITSVKLIKQPKGQPWQIGLTLGATIGTSDGSKPSALSNLTFFFPRASVNAGAFPSCTLGKLKAKGARGCPRGSKLGTGTSLIDASPLLNPAHAKITMFNGPRKGGNATFLFLAQAQEVAVTIYLQGTLKRQHGRFGYKLSMPFPKIPTISGYPDASVSQFQVNVQAFGRQHGRRVPLLEAPTSCPSPGWLFEGDFAFYDGQKGTAKTTIGCTLTGTPA